ncbi:hypothetical protein KM043_016965 [Ampulex compressa]|nr:hypothetical protein KM043_016965 [Ampulex compressa]
MWLPFKFETAIELFHIAIDVIFYCITTLPMESNMGKEVLQYQFSSKEIEAVNALARNTFPDRFLFGVVAPPWHINDTWKKDDTGTCKWTNEKIDVLSSEYCESVERIDTPYLKHKGSIIVGKNLGIKMYSITLSWSKILPTGFTDYINQNVISYYTDMIDELLDNGITPMVTLFHGDTPNPLKELGGWFNPEIVQWFEIYARIAFTAFGQKVKYWIIMNDPNIMCAFGNDSREATPGNQSWIANYLCGHQALLAYAKVYRLYKREFQSKQKGKVGFAQVCAWVEPEDHLSNEDLKAIERVHQWFNGWFLNPIVHKNGDYPRMMQDRIAFKSHVQKFLRSRLPRFTEKQLISLNEAADFVGINFNTNLRARGWQINLQNPPSFFDDFDAHIYFATTTEKVKNIPQTFEQLLRRLHSDYTLPEIYIIENSYSDFVKNVYLNESFDYRQHIRYVLKAMQAGVNIKGYLIRNLNFNFTHYSNWKDVSATNYED